MHEMSIAESLMELIAEGARKESFRRVRRIRVQLGVLGHVEPEALLFCFDAAAKGRIGEGAVLEVETVPGVGRCPACGLSVEIAQRYDLCPVCGSHVEMTAGDELRLMELEVE